MMNIGGYATQIADLVLALAMAPLLVGWVNMCRAWLQNRSAPSILLPYYTLRKLFHSMSSHSLCENSLLSINLNPRKPTYSGRRAINTWPTH